MPTTTAALKAVEKDVFDRTLELVKICDASERHFNDLQSRYRSLASTWLLASFGGIGFFLSTDLQVGVSRSTMVSGIAVAGALGISLLWILDVLVYHELLIRYHVAGQHLEKACDWLPPVRSRFGAEASPLSVRHYVAAFYVAGVVVLTGGTLIVLWTSAPFSWSQTILLAAAGSFLPVTMLGLTKRALLWKKDLSPWITKT